MCIRDSFKFTGWHPYCRCHAVVILKTLEEIKADNERIMLGQPLNGESANKVSDVPPNFKEWRIRNHDRIQKATKNGTLPYFLKDLSLIHIYPQEICKEFKLNTPIYASMCRWGLFGEYQQDKVWE